MTTPAAQFCRLRPLCPAGVFFGLVALAFCSGAAGGLRREQILDLYARGKSAFREATEKVESEPERARELFRRAAMAFESIEREGSIRNGRLYYNTGNAYFRAGDLGRAILNYRRALYYIPNDPNLQQNLSYARARRPDRIPEPESRKVLRTLFFWHYDFSLKVRSFLFMGGFALFWFCLGCRLFWRSGWLAWVAGVCGIFCVFLVCSLGVDAYRQRTERPGVVISPAAVARKGDSTTYAQAFTEPLHAGTEFTVYEDRGEWLEVVLADGRRCWLARSDVGLVR